MEASSSRPRTRSEDLVSRSRLIKQGAEARVCEHPGLVASPTIYWPSSSSSSHPVDSCAPSSSSSTAAHSFLSGPLILKHRFPKTYRHPTLDQQLTRSRLSQEARALARASRAGVVVPRVGWVDPEGGVLGLEKVEGWSVREVLGGGAEGEGVLEEEEEEQEPGPDGEAIKVVHGVQSLRLAGGREEAQSTEGTETLMKLGVTPEDLMASIGAALARLHITTIIHGDLTTSNMMVRLTPQAAKPYEIVLIDFGLSSTAQLPENYAVDLYVLERAFASTHPASEGLYAGVLESYAKGMGEKKWKAIEVKLRDVRSRGRKRDMTG